MQAHFIDMALHQFAVWRLDVRVGREWAVKLTKDYKNRFMPQRALETQQQWFAKAGMSGLGIAFCGFMHDGCDLADVEISMMYHTKGADAGQASPDALAAFRVWLSIDANLAKLTAVGSVAIVVDNAAAFHCASYVAGAAELLLRHGIFTIEFYFCCPGHGKTSLDGSFGVLGRKLREWVNGGHDLVTPAHLHDATQYAGSCASAVFDYDEYAADTRDVELPSLPMGVRYCRVVPVERDEDEEDEEDAAARPRSTAQAAHIVTSDSESSFDSDSESGSSYEPDDEEEEGTAEHNIAPAPTRTRAAAAHGDVPARRTRGAARQAVEYKIQCFLSLALVDYAPAVEIGGITATGDVWNTPPGVQHAHVVVGEGGSPALAGVGKKTQGAKLKVMPGCGVDVMQGGDGRDGTGGEWAIFPEAFVRNGISKNQTELTIDMDVKCLFVWWLSSTYIRAGVSWHEVERRLASNYRQVLAAWLHTPTTASYYKIRSGNDIARFKENQLLRMCSSFKTRLAAAIAANKNVESVAFHIPGRGSSVGIFITAESSPYITETTDG